MSLPTELLGGAVVVLLVCLFSASHVARYYFKFFTFLLLSLISATVFIPTMLFRPGDSRNALLPAWGARQVSKLLGLKWKIRGKENIVQDSGCVVLINHQSGIDLIGLQLELFRKDNKLFEVTIVIVCVDFNFFSLNDCTSQFYLKKEQRTNQANLFVLVLAELWPILERCTVISKQEVFYMWPFGLAAWLWGTIFINRLNNEQAQSTVNKTGETIRTKKAKLCMFPEGTRNGGKDLLPFKKGAFHVAIASQTLIQPVIVSHYYFLDSTKHRFDSGSSIISILPPITTEGLTKSDLQSLMDKTYSCMSDEYTKVSSEALHSRAS